MTRDAPARTRVPLLSWLFVGLAAVQLGLLVAADWYRFFGPFLILRPSDVTGAMTAIAPFLLAAAVLAGMPRWPAGRRWLLAGGLLFGLVGIAQGALSTWWAWRISEPAPLTDPTQAILVFGSTVAAFAAVVAPLCLAAGLADADPPRRRPGGLRLLAIGLAAAAGLLALVSGLGVLLSEVAVVEDATVLIVIFRTLETLGAVALAVLAAAALRAMPEHRPLPEMLIAAGATLAALGAAWMLAAEWFAFASGQAGLLTWTVTVSWVLTAAGMLLLIAGFAAAAVARAPREP